MPEQGPTPKTGTKRNRGKKGWEERERLERQKAVGSQGWRMPLLIFYMESPPLKLYLRTSLTVELQGLNLPSFLHNN